MNTIKRLLTLLFSSFIISGIMVAQEATKNDVVLAFNKGLEAQQAEDFTAAIAAYHEALDLARQVGEEADDIVINIETQLPTVYYQQGMTLYNAKKIDEALTSFKETIEVAERYNDQEVIKRAVNASSQLYYLKGTTSFQANKFDEALGFLNKSVELAPDNARTLYMIAANYRSLDNVEKLREAALKAVEVARAKNDNRYLESTNKLAGDFLLVKGNAARRADNNSEAVKLLNYALEFDEKNAATYYLLIQANNSLKNWDAAITAAEKALEYEKNDPAEKAKVYYELGNAQRGTGNTQAACEAFKQAAVGPFKESSEYIIQHELKCP